MMPLKGLSIAKPAAPSNPVLTRGSEMSLKFAWEQSTDYYHKIYKVYRSTDDFVADETLIKITTGLSYTDHDLAVDTWYYRVTDVDIHGVESDPSATTNYEMKEPLPFTDTFLVTTGTGVITKDINTSLGRNATSGTVVNNGPETVTVELSYNGTTFPVTFDMIQFDLFDLTERKSRIAIDSLRFTSTDASLTAVLT